MIKIKKKKTKKKTELLLFSNCTNIYECITIKAILIKFFSIFWTEVFLLKKTELLLFSNRTSIYECITIKAIVIKFFSIFWTEVSLLKKCHTSLRYYELKTMHLQKKLILFPIMNLITNQVYKLGFQEQKFNRHQVS